MSEGNVVTYDRISEDPRLFHEVINRQLVLSDEVREGKIHPDAGKVQAAALIGATRTLDADIRSRALAHKVRVFEHQISLPDKRETSGDEKNTGERSQSQLSDSPSV